MTGGGAMRTITRPLNAAAAINTVINNLRNAVTSSQAEMVHEVSHIHLHAASATGSRFSENVSWASASLAIDGAYPTADGVAGRVYETQAIAWHR